MADGTIKILTDLSTEGFQSGLSKLGGIAKTGLSAVTTGVTAVSTALVGVGAASIKTGSEFDSGMSQIAATLGITTQEINDNVNGAGDTFDALRAKALQMGSETNFTATQAADGLNILAMSGYDAEQSIGMIEDVLHLSAAGAMDMGDAAGYVAGAMKGFADESKDSAYYADLMAKGATLANTNVQQLGEAMSGGAAVASSYNQTADSMTIALLRLAEQGETGSNAATALSAAMKNLYAPTDQAKEVMKQLGVEAFDPATGQARDFNDVVNELGDALSGYSDEQRTAYAQTIFGIQGFNAYNKMVVTSTEKQQEWADALAASSGEAAKQYDTMTDNLQGDLDIFNSAIDGLKIGISDRLMPEVRDFVQFGADAVSQFSQAFQEGGLSGAMEAFGSIVSDGIAKLVEKLPELFEAGGKLLTSLVDGLMDNLPALMEAGIGKILPQLISTGSDLVLSIADGIVNALPSMVDQAVNLVDVFCDSFIDTLPKLLSAAQKAIPIIVKGLSQALPKLLHTGRQVIAELTKGLAQALPDLIPAAVEIIMSLVQGLVDDLPLLLDTALQLITGLADGLIQAIPVLIAALPQLIQGIVDFLVQGIPQIIQAAIQIINGLVAALPDIIAALIEALPQIIESIVSGLISCIGQLVTGAIQLVTALVAHLPEIIAGLVAAIPEIITALIDGFIAGLGSFIDAGEQIIDALGEGISTAWQSIVRYFTEVIPSLIDNIGQWFSELPGRVTQWLTTLLGYVGTWAVNMWSKAKETGKNFIDGVINFVKTLPQNVWNWLKNVVSKVVSFAADFVNNAKKAGQDFMNGLVNKVKEIPGKMLSIGGDIVRGIWNGISGAASWLWNQISGFCSNIVNGIKNFFGIGSPSRLMAAEVGRWLPPGIAGGFEDAAPEAADDIQGSLDDMVEGLDTPTIPIDVTAGMIDSGILDEIPAVVEATNASLSARAAGTWQDNDPTQKDPIDYDKLAEAMSNVQLRATVQMNAKAVAEETTPYTNRNMGDQMALEKRRA